MRKFLAWLLWYRWIDRLSREAQGRFEGGTALLAVIAAVVVLVIAAVVRVGISLVWLFGAGIWISPGILPESQKS